MSDHRSTEFRPSTLRAPLPLLLIAVAIATSALGCAFGEFRPGDPFDREWSLEQAQHRYTTLVRFGDFDRARDFVAEDERDQFMVRMKALDGARFTEYDSEPIELDEEMDTAKIKVTYTVYTPAIPFEFEVVETQLWSRDGISNNWRVRTLFDGLQNLAAK